MSLPLSRFRNGIARSKGGGDATMRPADFTPALVTRGRRDPCSAAVYRGGWGLSSNFYVTALPIRPPVVPWRPKGRRGAWRQARSETTRRWLE